MGERTRAVEDLAVTEPRLPDADFWRGKRVLLTGHTGFKGAWTALWLHQMGAEVHGLALPPDTQPSLYDAADVKIACASSIMCDIRDSAKIADAIARIDPEIVLHLAAQALVSRL